jgi:hypothetical protein
MKIIGISGKKQSGKNTMANFINGVVLKKINSIEDFSISEYGELVIETVVEEAREEGVLDVTRKDSSFVQYAEIHLWPYVKVYSFADGLKTLCMNFFDLSFEQVYGTDQQKNTETNVYWSDLPTPNIQLRNKRMTARELLQYFGTDIMRRMNTNVWVNHAIKTIKEEASQIAIIPDVRFPNEVDSIKDAGGKVIRLERQFQEDAHSSECALDKDQYDWNNFDLVIDNSSGGTQEFVDEVSKSIKALEL